MSEFQLFKLALSDLLGLSKDALHIGVGMCVFVVVWLATSPKRRPWLPFLCVAAVAAAGEAWDLIETWRAGETLRWDLSGKDVVNTIFWPAVLTIALSWSSRRRARCG